METAKVARVDADVGPGGALLARLVRAAVEQLRQWFPNRVVAIYVERQLDEPAIAQISPSKNQLPDDEYSLPLRFASWLTAIDATRVQAVPTYLLPWLPVPKALVMPLVVDGCHRGAIAVDAASLGRTEVRQIEQLAQRLSGKLQDFERRAPQGVDSVRDRFAHSVLRIKTATQV